MSTRLPVAAYVQHVHVPVEPLPAVLHSICATLDPEPHVPLTRLPACAVSELAASSA